MQNQNFIPAHRRACILYKGSLIKSRKSCKSCENLIFALLRVVQIWQLHYALSKLEIFYTLCKFAHVYYTLSKFDICIITLVHIWQLHLQFVQIWKFHQTLCKFNIFLLLTTGSMPIRHLRIEPFVEENK